MPGPAPLPARVRRLAILSMGVAGLIGIGSANEAAMLSNLDALREVPLARSGATVLFADRAVMEKAMEAQVNALILALKPMAAARGLTLAALAVASALVFVSAGRLLRPAGLPREGARALLGGSAIVSAVLRTLDGAQLAAVAEKVGLAVGKQFALSEPYRADPASAEVLPRMMGVVLTGFSVGLTVLMVGALASLGFYFRSAKVRLTVAAEDERLS